MQEQDVKKLNPWEERLIVKYLGRPEQEGGIIIPNTENDLSLGLIIEVNEQAEYMKKLKQVTSRYILFSKSRGLKILLPNFEDHYLLASADILSFCE